MKFDDDVDEVCVWFTAGKKLLIVDCCSFTSDAAAAGCMRALPLLICVTQHDHKLGERAARATTTRCNTTRVRALGCEKKAVNTHEVSKSMHESEQAISYEKHTVYVLVRFGNIMSKFACCRRKANSFSLRRWIVGCVSLADHYTLLIIAPVLWRSCCESDCDVGVFVVFDACTCAEVLCYSFSLLVWVMM